MSAEVERAGLEVEIRGGGVGFEEEGGVCAVCRAPRKFSPRWKQASRKSTYLCERHGDCRLRNCQIICRMRSCNGSRSEPAARGTSAIWRTRWLRTSTTRSDGGFLDLDPCRWKGRESVRKNISKPRRTIYDSTTRILPFEELREPDLRKFEVGKTLSQVGRCSQPVDLALEMFFKTMDRVGIPSVVRASEEEVVNGVDVEFEMICEVQR